MTEIMNMANNIASIFSSIMSTVKGTQFYLVRVLTMRIL